MYSTSAGTMASSQNSPMLKCGDSLLRRNVPGSGVRAGAEEMPLGLLHEVLARLGIGEIEAVLVHQHGLLLEPLRPCLLRDVLPDALAEIAGVGREIETVGLAAELDALHHPSHRAIICASKRPSNRGASYRAPGAGTAAPSRRPSGSPAR